MWPFKKKPKYCTQCGCLMTLRHEKYYKTPFYSEKTGEKYYDMQDIYRCPNYNNGIHDYEVVKRYVQATGEYGECK